MPAATDKNHIKPSRTITAKNHVSEISLTVDRIFLFKLFFYEIAHAYRW